MITHRDVPHGYIFCLIKQDYVIWYYSLNIFLNFVLVHNLHSSLLFKYSYLSNDTSIEKLLLSF